MGGGTASAPRRERRQRQQQPFNSSETKQRNQLINLINSCFELNKVNWLSEVEMLKENEQIHEINE